MKIILRLLGLIVMITGVVGLWQYDLGTNDFISSQIDICVGLLVILFSCHL